MGAFFSVGLRCGDGLGAGRAEVVGRGTLGDEFDFFGLGAGGRTTCFGKGMSAVEVDGGGLVDCEVDGAGGLAGWDAVGAGLAG